MSDDNYTPILGLVFCTAVLCFVYGHINGTVTARGETEEQTVVYCVEQPNACKTKYDFYKLENQK